MSCPEDQHDMRALNPFVVKGVTIVGAPPQTKEEVAWCRICGALWCESPFGMGWGWIHPADDQNAPNLLNILRKHVEEGEGDKPFVQELPKPSMDKFNAEVIRVWMSGPDETNYAATVVVDIGFFGETPECVGELLAITARSVARSAKDNFGIDEGMTIANIQRVFNGELGQPRHEIDS